MGPPFRFRRLPAALALAVAASGLAAPAASGHAAFEGGRPAPGSRVETAPAQVVLVFTEPLNRRLTEATLSRPGEGRVAARQAIRGRRLVLTPRSRLARGSYRVRWRTVSTEDGHPLEGSFGFGVRAAAAGGGAAVEQSPLAGGGWLRALSRALLYTALLLFAGALIVRALLNREWPAGADPRGREPAGLGPAAGSPAGSGASEPAPFGPAAESPAGGGVATLAPAAPPAPPAAAKAARARAEALVLDAGLATASLAAASAIVDSADAAGGLSVTGVRDYLLTSAAGLARVLLVVLALAALALARRAPRLAMLAAVGALGCVVASGHARSADPRAVAVLADWAHLAAGAVWLGGAALLVLVWGPELRDAAARRAVARDVLPAFGRVALPAFVAVVVAGAVNAAVELGAVADLWSTAYGRVLLVKVGLAALAAAAAFVHVRLRPRLLAGGPEPRHWLALRAEVGLGAGVVAVAGLLVAFPLPPRQLDAATGQGGAVAPCEPCPLPAARPGELTVAEQAGGLVVAGWIRREAGGLAGTIRTLDFRGRPGQGPIAVPGGGARPCGRGCARFSIATTAGGLRVRVTERGRAYTAVLPARWHRGQGARGRSLLRRAERTMRGLRSLREDEWVTSGPGTLAVARYRLRAPDRLAYTTNRGVRSVQIGRRQWLRTPGSPWRVGTVPGGAPFRTREWFRWTPYARHVELLGTRTEAGRQVAELAAADPATPVWFRLTVDVRSGRVLRERLVAQARRIDHRFFGFNAPVDIEPPRKAISAG